MTNDLVREATALCDALNERSVDELKTSDAAAMAELRDKARQLADHLDAAIVKITPCKYNRATVEEDIHSFAHYKFRRMTGLCDHNLGPLLQSQVGEALRAERGDIALDMLVPILTFFASFTGYLDDSFGSGSQFVGDCASRTEKAMKVLPEGWADGQIADDLLVAINGCRDYNESFKGVKTALEAMAAKGHRSEKDHPLGQPSKKLKL